MATRHRVLIVDDDEQVRRQYGSTLVEADYECAVASRCGEAHGLLADGDFSLVICDVRIAGESGLDLVRAIASDHPATTALMASHEDDPVVAEIAFDNGAYAYMVKPLTRNQLLIGVANALYRRRLERQNESHRERLEQAVRERAGELRAAIEGMRVSQEETVHRLSRAVEMRDVPDGQLERVGAVAGLLGSRLGLTRERVELLRIAAPMHDVGKIGIPDQILLKPGELTDRERREMERHTEIGYELLSNSDSELLSMAAVIALTHHERFDGGGYPRGLAGEEIPLEGRIVAVADVFDALISDRAYRPAFSLDEAVQTMVEGRGTQFDPTIVDALLENLHAVTGFGTQALEEVASSRAPAGLDSLPPPALASPRVRHEQGHDPDRQPREGVE
jgi:putative two-component system response regulator